MVTLKNFLWQERFFTDSLKYSLVCLQRTPSEECHIYLENDTTNEYDSYYRKGLKTDKLVKKRCHKKVRRQIRKGKPYKLYIGIHKKGRVMRACRAGPYGKHKSIRFLTLWTTPPPEPGPPTPVSIWTPSAPTTTHRGPFLPSTRKKPRKGKVRKGKVRNKRKRKSQRTKKLDNAVPFSTSGNASKRKKRPGRRHQNRKGQSWKETYILGLITPISVLQPKPRVS